MNPSRRIILDIGTGDGQSTDDHIRSTEYSYVFVEPDQSKRQSLKSQLRVKQILTAPRQVLQFLSQLKTGKAKYAIVNCKLDDLLDDPSIRSVLLQELKCAVACFSAQFIRVHSHVSVCACTVHRSVLHV